MLARTHGSFFLERYEDRSLLGLVAVAAAPNLGSPDARTAVDVALQLRDRGEARAKGPEWSRFRDLAKEFIGRSPRHARGVDRGVVVGHCRAALPHLLVAACSIQDRAYLDDDIARCVDALAADLGDGRAGAALAVALLAAQTDSWSQRAARGLLPACGDFALCALEGLRHPPNEGLQQAFDAIGDATMCLVRSGRHAGRRFSGGSEVDSPRAPRHHGHVTPPSVLEAVRGGRGKSDQSIITGGRELVQRSSGVVGRFRCF